jgi:anti-sigma factor RsiW
MTRHLSKEQLLRHLDGEMSMSGMRNAAEHLHACWACQVEFSRLKEHIAAILDAHVNVLSPSLPPPSAPWPRLEPRLERAMRSNPRPFWRTAVAFGEAPLERLLAFGAVAAALVLILFRVFTR